MIFKIYGQHKKVQANMTQTYVVIDYDTSEQLKNNNSK